MQKYEIILYWIIDCRFSRPWRLLAYILGPLTNRVVIDVGNKKHKLRFELDDFCSLRKALRSFQEGPI